VDRPSPDLLDEDTADRMLGGLVSPADAPPGYAPVAELLAAARGDREGGSAVHAPVVRPLRRSHHGARLVALLAAVMLVVAASASYADVLPVSTASIQQAVNTMLDQTPAPVTPGARRWVPEYMAGADPASAAGTCTAGRDTVTGTLRLSCPAASSQEVVRYDFAAKRVASAPTFGVETGPKASGLLRTSISRVSHGRLVLTVRVTGPGVLDVRSVRIGYYEKG
jgi:hypothetical protein